jgi:DNA-binding transcriptional LysR family regulator
MELRHLRYFIAVAEEKSFRRAADRLHVSASPLIRQIQDLEYEVGVPLLVRSNSGVALTDAGRAVFENALAIVEQSQQLFQLARHGGGEARQVRIAYSVAHVDPVLPELIKACRRDLPPAEFELRQMNSDHMMHELLERKIDLAFPGIGDSNRTHELVFETIRRSPVCAVLPKDHPLATAAAVGIADLADSPFILLPRARISWYNNWVLGLCRYVGFNPTIVAEADSTHTMLAMVAAGIGVGILPALVAGMPIDVCLRALTPAPALFEFQIAWHRKDKSTVLPSVIEIVRSLIAAMPERVCGMVWTPDAPSPGTAETAAGRDWTRWLGTGSCPPLELARTAGELR